MVDEDTLLKVKEVLKVGWVSSPVYRDGRQPIYRFRITRDADARRLLKAIYPFMSKRRAERIEHVLAA